MPVDIYLDTFLTKKKVFHLSQLFEKQNIVNDGQFETTQLADTDMSNSLTFCVAEKYVDQINKNEAISSVIARGDLIQKLDSRLAIVRSADPNETFYDIHNRIYSEIHGQNQSILGDSQIKDSADIHSTAFVEDGCYIGENVKIGAGARIFRNTYIGDDCIIGPNVVIGSEGLEFKQRPDGSLFKVVHAGGVVLEKDVEVMANSVVAKDVFIGFTFIGEGTKIGPLCNIGHRVKIGKYCRVAGNTSIAGSVRIGDQVWLGPSSTISNGVTIEDRAKISLGSVVVQNVREGRRVSGFFAVDHSKALKNHTAIVLCK